MSMPTPVAVRAFLGFIALALGGCGDAEPVPTRARVDSFARESLFGRNLIVNGGAEQGPEGWSKNENLGFSSWGGTAGEWDYGVRVLPDQGANYFRLTIPADQETTKVRQTIDVSPAAGDIDRGAVSYRLSGYFGGLRDEPGTTLLAVHFIDASGKAIGEAATDPVLARALPKEKVGQASVAMREKSGAVPPGTRKVEAEFVGKNLKFTESPSETIGFADNLSLVLHLD